MIQTSSSTALVAATALVFPLLSVTASADMAEITDRIVVTAAGFEQVRAEAPGSITVITAEELQARPAANLAELLSDLPGVDVDGLDARSNKTGNASINLRGLPSEYTLVLIDGRRQNVPGTVAPNAFNDSASVFFPPISAIERIEIVRSPMSTLYGADALAGVVNIITRPTPEDWTGSVSVAGLIQGDSDFGGERTVEAWGGGRLADQLGLQLYGRSFERSASRSRVPSQDLSRDRRRSMGQNPVSADIHTLGTRLNWEPIDLQVFELGVDVTRQTYDNSLGELGRINTAAEPGSPEFPDLRSGYAPELGFDRDQFYLGHEGQFDFGVWTTTLTRNETETTGRTIPNAAASEESGRRGTPRRLEARTTVLESKLVSDIGPNRLSVGVQYIDASLFDGIPNRRFETEQYGIFVENQWQMRERVLLTGGLRYDDNDAFGGQFTPRLYLVHKTTDNLVLKGGIGRGYRAPFLEQLEDGIIGFGEGGTVPLFGNPDLNPEESTNIELTAVYRNGGLSAEATLFYTELENRVARPVGATGGTTDNIGEAEIYGLELAGSYQISAPWSVDLNYTYLTSEITSDEAADLNRGDPIFPTPEHSLNARLNWQATDRLNTFVGMQYRSSRFRPDNFHEPHLGGQAQGAAEALGDFRGFTTFNLGTRFFISDRVELRAVIENLLDKDFNDYRPYPLRNDPEVTAFSNVYNNIYPPRRLWISLTTNF